MKASLIQGLNEKDMQAVVNTYNLKPFYYPSLFKLKFTPTLTWKALIANLGVPVAADVVSYNSSAPKKTRQVIQKASGDIPKIEISRVKEETDLNEYQQLLHYSNTTEGAKAILDWIYDDTQFVWDGVNARLEWLALQALSTGQIALTMENNNGIVTETAVDFLVPTANKTGVGAGGVKWTAANYATMKPITLIKAKAKAAKDSGYPVNYILMDETTFDILCAATETVNLCASWVLKATNLAATTSPTLADVNKALEAQKLPQIVVIDSRITIEKTDGTRTVVNPWETGRITFVPSLQVGNTYYAPLADDLVQSSAAIRVKREHVLIKKFSIEDPVQEVTKGLANAFPAWGSATLSYIVDTLHTGYGADL